MLKAKEGPEVPQIAERHAQPIHLMLTDLIMPQMSGRELSEKIAGIHPETKVVFMSGYSNNLLSNEQVIRCRAYSPAGTFSTDDPGPTGMRDSRP